MRRAERLDYAGPVSSGLRIIDANLNRAREGLRVLEDVARFHLNDGAIAARVKQARHGLREAVGLAGWTEFELQFARDTPGDVGVTIKTDAEFSRASVREVAIAAGKRVGEALRSIEENAKALGVGGGSAAGASVFERLRYQTYDIERAIIVALGPERTAPQWRLCVLITGSLCALPWMEVARQARLAGADCFQLREKSLGDREFLERARQLVEIAGGPCALRSESSPARASVIINDRADIALLAGADGVHLGQDDLLVADARRVVGQGLLIGVSTHSMGEAQAAAEAGADYLGVGAMFSSTTKSRETSGGEYLRALVSDSRSGKLPHLAISGITPENVRELIGVGCQGIAVCSVVCGSSEPGRVCGELLKAFEV